MPWLRWSAVLLGSSAALLWELVLRPRLEAAEQEQQQQQQLQQATTGAKLVIVEDAQKPPPLPSLPPPSQQQPQQEAAEACLLSEGNAYKKKQKKKPSEYFKKLFGRQRVDTMSHKEGAVIVVEKKDAWDEILSKAAAEGKTVIVDFSATWCSPCRVIGPFFKDLADKNKNIIFLKIDVDQLADVAEACSINAMPTFQVFKNGEMVDEQVGASKEKLQKLVEKYA